MPLISCEITEGPRPGFKTVGVQTVEGRKEFFSIEDRFLAKRGEDYLLPVFVIGKDKHRQMVLVQLPLEADSGARRVWLYSKDLISEPSEVPA